MDVFSDDFIEARMNDLKERVGARRYQHSLGVAQTARKLAAIYGIDGKKAYLTGILHDWDKGMRNNDARKRAKDLGVVDKVGKWTVKNMPEVLHGPTAAVALGREYPDIPEDVLHAISVHTIATKHMSDLDKIIYIADAIEPSRSYPDFAAINEMIGNVSLNELYRTVYKSWITTLISKDVVLHPDTIKIWNHLTKKRSLERKSRFD